MSDELPAHSLRGPSSGDRWIYRKDRVTGQYKGCARSVQLSEGQPDTESIYAAEGTAAHWIAQLCRENNKPASHYLGYTDPVEMRHPDGGSIECDHEMVEAVQVFLDYVNTIPCCDAYYEEKVTYMEWVPHDGFGTADDIRFNDRQRVCHITDLKYGKGIQVYATDNIQLLLYALGVYENYYYLYDFDRFVLSISQPRLDHVDEWEVSVEDLLIWAENVVRPAAKLTRRKDAPINPGSWCRWCPIKKRCRTRIIWTLQTTDIESELITNQELSAVLPLLSGIKSLCKELEELALTEALKGGVIYDHKVVEGRSNRQWVDEAKAQRAMLGDGFRRDDVIVSSLISPAQFEKLAGKDHPILVAKQGRSRYVRKPEGRPTLVPDSDKRPPFGLDAKKEFADFNDVDDDDALDGLL